MRLGLESNLAEVIKRIKAAGDTQLPFATAVALTRTAGNVKTRAVSEFAQRFTLRNKFTQSGVRVQPATKDSPIAGVGLTERVDSYLHKFLKDREKIPFHGNYLAIPTSNVKRNKRDIIPARNRPKALFADPEKNRVFVLTLKRGAQAGEKVIFQRFGNKRGDARALYMLVRKARINPNLGIQQWGQDEVQKNWPGNFRDALITALRTSR